ncbi:hypothetical protein FA13DRAFT_1146050 [Coprinellus micaceus]|uniref:Uncharacterized protein n=1 Tax=Coprinellus micaceus TaxID=71717 RepID=A0A4Y7RJ25_COPMI|nr:hypothetical protein FA13DRAFT_1146050 [Coprinellus micaceus]
MSSRMPGVVNAGTVGLPQIASWGHLEVSCVRSVPTMFRGRYLDRHTSLHLTGTMRRVRVAHLSRRGFVGSYLRSRRDCSPGLPLAVSTERFIRRHHSAYSSRACIPPSRATLA